MSIKSVFKAVAATVLVVGGFAATGATYLHGQGSEAPAILGLSLALYFFGPSLNESKSYNASAEEDILEEPSGGAQVISIAPSPQAKIS